MPDQDLPIADFDARIKRVIEVMHVHFMRLFFPQLSLRLLFPEKAPSMDKELQKIFADWKKKGWTLGDKLLGYQTLDGEQQLILIHVEAHGGGNADFKKLQFVRFYRLQDQFPDAKITQLVIYIGDAVPPRPFEYRQEFEGTINIHRFNIYLVKKQSRRTLLRLSKTNPFALVILALLENLETKDEMERRRKTKLRLMRLCLESPFRDLTQELLIFVAYSIALPIKEEALFWEEFEETVNQPVMETVETNPNTGLFLQRLLFGGKTYLEYSEEKNKVKEREIILNFYRNGVDIKIIAHSLGKDIKYIQEIVRESKKRNTNGQAN